MGRQNKTVNPFQKFVARHAQLFASGKKLPPANLKKFARQKISDKAPEALIFSPHPDDECITGGLALRLLREADWNVTNVAVTLGSNRGRQAARLRELKRACASLGFNLVVPGKRALEQVTLNSRNKNPTRWKMSVKLVAKVLAEHSPRVIFLPHALDGHAAHIGAHYLVMDALKSLPRDFQCFVVETEFWRSMDAPNLLVESGIEDVAGLIGALACHVGEVRRNPYHARLPAWLMDNVRRGAELVGGQGGSSPDFTFGTIYRLGMWRGGRRQDIFTGGKILNAAESPVGLF